MCTTIGPRWNLFNTFWCSFVHFFGFSSVHSTKPTKFHFFCSLEILEAIDNTLILCMPDDSNLYRSQNQRKQLLEYLLPCWRYSYDWDKFEQKGHMITSQSLIIRVWNQIDWTNRFLSIWCSVQRNQNNCYQQRTEEWHSGLTAFDGNSNRCERRNLKCKNVKS